MKILFLLLIFYFLFTGCGPYEPSINLPNEECQFCYRLQTSSSGTFIINQEIVDTTCNSSQLLKVYFVTNLPVGTSDPTINWITRIYFNGALITNQQSVIQTGISYPIEIPNDSVVHITPLNLNLPLNCDEEYRTYVATIGYSPRIGQRLFYNNESIRIRINLCDPTNTRCIDSQEDTLITLIVRPTNDGYWCGSDQIPSLGTFEPPSF